MERIHYDEFGLFGENAAEYGLSPDPAPVVSRIEDRGGSGFVVSALQWADGPDDGAAVEVVFLHGGAQNAHTWDTVAMAMRPHRLLAIDLPGHGHSQWKSDRRYDPRSLADDVAPFIEKHAPNALAVVGMSLGGLTALALAARHPPLVRKVVSVDATPGTTLHKAQAIADFVRGPQSFPDFDSLLARTIEHNPTRTEASLRRGILHNARQLDDGSWQWRYDRLEDDQTGGALLDAIPVVWDDVSAIKAPMMLVRGVLSPVVDDADEAEMRRRQPSMRAVHVEGAGHSVQGDRPLELAALLEEFVFG
jgi:pimeloyl-ACP methyl ester carboxylesterase